MATVRYLKAVDKPASRAGQPGDIRELTTTTRGNSSGPDTSSRPIRNPELRRSEKMTSLRDAILAADDLEREEVTVEGWEFPVFVRVISGRERQQLVEKWQQVKEDEAGAAGSPAVRLCLVPGRPGGLPPVRPGRAG